MLFRSDVGTDNEELLNDPDYLGNRHGRVRGKRYDALVNEYLSVASELYPRALLHFEDFGASNARRILVNNRDKYRIFNDDMQGTGAIVISAVIAGMKTNGTTFADQRLLVYGAGTAGTGMADQIHAGMVRAGLTSDQVHQVRIERELPDLDLSEYSGAFVCGSPWDANADDHLKEERQVRAEAWLRSFYDRALGESFPILGLCYGLGTLTLHLGGVIDTHHGEEISGIALTKTDAGREDPLLEGTPDRFHSYVGHHEAVRELAPGMQVLLAGDDTPIQMVRVGEAAWATQFHPEMDLEGVNVRIDQYAGRYYPVEKAEAIRAQVATVDTDPSRIILRNFVSRFQR